MAEGQGVAEAADLELRLSQAQGDLDLWRQAAREHRSQLEKIAGMGQPNKQAALAARSFLHCNKLPLKP